MRNITADYQAGSDSITSYGMYIFIQKNSI